MTCLPSAARQSGANALPASLILTQIRDLIYRVAGIFQAEASWGCFKSVARNASRFSALPACVITTSA